jgi:hypothetical protein
MVILLICHLYFIFWYGFGWFGVLCGLLVMPGSSSERVARCRDKARAKRNALASVPLAGCRKRTSECRVFFANVLVVSRLVVKPESFAELNRREILDGFPCGCCCAEPSPSNE